MEQKLNYSLRTRLWFFRSKNKKGSSELRSSVTLRFCFGEREEKLDSRGSAQCPPLQATLRGLEVTCDLDSSIWCQCCALCERSWSSCVRRTMCAETYQCQTPPIQRPGEETKDRQFGHAAGEQGASFPAVPPHREGLLSCTVCTTGWGWRGHPRVHQLYKRGVNLVLWLKKHPLLKIKKL